MNITCLYDIAFCFPKSFFLYMYYECLSLILRRDTPLLLLSTHVSPTARLRPPLLRYVILLKLLQFTQTIFEKSKAYKAFSMTYSAQYYHISRVLVITILFCNYFELLVMYYFTGSLLLLPYYH